MAAARSLDHLGGPFLDPLQSVHTFFVCGREQNLTQYSRWGLVCAKQSGIVTFLLLLVMPLLMQPSIPLQNIVHSY